MTDFSYTNVNVPHAPSVIGAIVEAIGGWRQRARERRQLSYLSARDIHDLGLTEQQVAYEINKPFWRT